MDCKQAFETFRKLEAELTALSHANGLLYCDGVTVAPSDSGEGRGRTMEYLSNLEYETMQKPENTEAVKFLLAHKDELSFEQRREVEEYNRSNEYMSSIPQEEYVAYTGLLNRAEEVWHAAKKNNDFKSFAPLLKELFAANIRFAGYYKPEKKPYDVQLDLFEKGLTMEKTDAFFAALREKIVPLLHYVMARPQVDDSFLHTDFPVDKQRELSAYLMRVLTIDPSHCTLGETEHPFTTNFNKKDVRITTHYHEDDFLSSMFSVVHEGGHALYELHSGDEWEYTSLSGGVSMGIHESQSRLYENLIGRSESFMELIFPKLLELFPTQFAGVTPHQLYLAANKAEPSLIRTEADELTYALHVMVRYEIEKGVFAGEIDIDKLPQIWNAKYKEYLGIDVPDDTHGVLQDSHWAGGNIGYFPSYALGSAYGAQILAKMKQDMDVDAVVASGDLSPIVKWLSERIYRFGCLYTPGELLERCCGEPFNPQYFTDYLEKKFKAIYG